ncbi:MAG: hypothetical protein ABIN25_07555 [Ginsengibacter sp.]
MIDVLSCCAHFTYASCLRREERITPSATVIIYTTYLCTFPFSPAATESAYVAKRKKPALLQASIFLFQWLVFTP